ncbi:MAG: type II secretion system F family protein [Candidatus Omnitrophota bacterium]|jgi:type II secretory pathway component PulF
MPSYKYRAKKGPDSTIEGNIEAKNKEEAIEKLNQMNYIPVRVEEFVSRAQSISSLKVTGRVRSGEITVFSRQLSSLIKSGVPILRAINIISEQSENPHFKNILSNIHNQIRDGKAFSTALMSYPGIFSQFYISMIRTGEDSGTLQEVLLRITDYRQQQEEFLSKIRTALAYPILMAIVGIATIIFMLIYVMPRLMQIFVNLGQELPLPTRILITISNWFQQHWFWIILGVVIFLVVLKQQAKAEGLQLATSRFRLHLPIFGEFSLKSELARFSRSLELLIRSGLPILKAIQVSIPILRNQVIKLHLLQSYQELEQGGSFGKSLKKAKLFPAFMTNLISVGEESGRLEEALAEVARTYEKDIDDTIKVMTSLLEPMMILVMGLVVGFIVVAMLLPIFQINVMAR